MSRKENKLAKIERRENARVLLIVIRQLKREAMFREGLASCSYCKAVLPRAEVRIPKNDPRKLAGECKRCRARNAKATIKNNPETYRRMRSKRNARVMADPTKRLVKSVRDRTNKALVNANIDKSTLAAFEAAVTVSDSKLALKTAKPPPDNTSMVPSELDLMKAPVLG